MAENARNDKEAKAAFVAELRSRGYERVAVTRSPADISAYINGDLHLFEVKFTATERQTYFGAATLTEWEAAVSNEGKFWFVVARKSGGKWNFDEYTPSQFMEFSYIPPFKVFFHVPLVTQKTRSPDKSSRVRLTKSRIAMMLELFKQFQKEGGEES